MKINTYSIAYKWKIITFFIRTPRSFHSLVSPLLALQISYSWYLLWPNAIHSFMKLSQAPAEVINYSSLECLYLRRSQYWVYVYPKAPHLLCLGPWWCGLLFSLKQRNEMYTAQNTYSVFPQAPENSSKRGLGLFFFLCVFLSLFAAFGHKWVSGD